MLLTIIAIIVVLSILIFVHELGHFLACRATGVKVEEFGFGYPPRAIGVQRKNKKWRISWGSKEIKPEDPEDNGSTIYSLNWIPIGGFVKMLGQDDFSVEGNLGDANPQNFRNKKAWQRALILSAGVAMNVLLCAVLLAVGFGVGLPQVLEEKQAGEVKDYKIQIIEALKDYPAAQAELKLGDTIVSIGNQAFTSLKDLQNFIAANEGQELIFQIDRAGELLEKKMIPQKLPDSERAGIGVSLVETGLVSYPWHQAIGKGFVTTGYLAKEIIFAFGRLFRDLFTAGKIAVDVAGPVGIAVITGQMARMGFIYLLQFTALLSLNLAIINFLPFPALDGGHLLFLIIEKIRRKPNNRKIEAIIHNVGFALLMLLVLLVTFRDVKNFLWDKIVGLF